MQLGETGEGDAALADAAPISGDGSIGACAAASCFVVAADHSMSARTGLTYSKPATMPGSRPPRAGSPRAIGVDEVAWQRGRFLTVVYQLDEHCRRLLWLGEDPSARATAGAAHAHGVQCA